MFSDLLCNVVFNFQFLFDLGSNYVPLILISLETFVCSTCHHCIGSISVENWDVKIYWFCKWFLTSKITCQPFLIMIFNSFALILQHIYSCQFQSYLFLNPKNTILLNLAPEGLQYPDIQCCQKSCQLR